MPAVRKYIFLFSFVLGCCTSSFAQLRADDYFGFNIGAVFSVGSKFQRFGISFQTYAFYDYAQLNAEIRFYKNFKNLGPELKYNECVAAVGVVMAFGPKQNYFNPFVSSTSNQTGRKHSIGYSYNAYINKIKTTQQTGIIALEFGDVTVLAENDILARPLLDRFRTGAFMIQYQYEDLFQAGINCTMWTGEMGKRCNSDEHFKNGYIDTTGGIYTLESHGLLSAQFKYAWDVGQYYQANIGVDAQQVRNVMQNKLIHDMPFIPHKWFKPINCHIPMIDSEGQQYLYKDGQKIKKPDFYWNLSTGTSTFY